MLYCNVVFAGTEKKYAYKTFYNDLVEGDTLLVQANGSVTTAMFVNYLDEVPVFLCKSVVGFINTKERSKYDA